MLSIQGMQIKICMDSITENTLRICLLPLRESVLDVFSTIDLAEREWREPSLTTHSDGVFNVNHFTVRAAGGTMSIDYDDQPLQTLTVSEASGAISFPLGTGPIYGLGHGYKQHFNRRGERYDLSVNGQVPGIIQNHSATSPSPYIISLDGWTLFFHQPWMAQIDLTGQNGVFSVSTPSPAMYADIFLTACTEPADAARAYYAITGKPPMPPKYSFGYQQSYRTLLHNGVEEVMRTARYMRMHDLPCDMLIYLGTGYCDHGWNTGHRSFVFHPEVFPAPEKTMRALHDMGYKINLHVTKCYTGLHGSINDSNVSPLEYDHVKNYWTLHERVYAQAQNEAWWPDDSDDVDITQRLTRHRMYYEGSLALNPDTRPFHMQRNAFPGHTKWGGVIWSGDVLSEWETLKNQVPIGLNASLSCSPYWGTDTGGFFCTDEFTGELFLRWFAYSAFTPFFRGHGRLSYLHNPWGWNRESLHDVPLEASPGTPRDGLPPNGALPDTRVEPICRKFLHERYKLLPFLYTLSREVYDTGMPMMRPMWFYFPKDATACALGSQYMLGDSLLVAPVTAKGAEHWHVYLPTGLWRDYWSGEPYEGGQWIDAPAALDQIPLYVKAGGILPRGRVTPFISAHKFSDDFEPLCVCVYPGADGEYTLYEDDGVSLGYQRGEYAKTSFDWQDAHRELKAVGVSGLYAGRERTVLVQIMPALEKRTLTIRYEQSEG